MKKISIALAMATLALTGAAAAKQAEHPARTNSYGFYVANLSTKYSMRVTYETCKSGNSGNCHFEEITLPAVDHGNNMQYVSAKYIMSVVEQDEAGIERPESVFQFGCHTISTEYTYTNMVALSDIPGTNKVSCVTMLASM